MVKNKALPDCARLCTPCLVTLSLSPSLTDLALSRLASRVFSLADAVHPEDTPWILPRLDPGNMFRSSGQALCFSSQATAYRLKKRTLKGRTV